MIERPTRRKPDPIPAIHPVPEYLADARLSAVYDETKRALNVPWMGVVTMAFAHYPTFYETLWDSVREVADTNAFRDACQSLRACAEAEAADLGPTDVIRDIASVGYARRERDAIRDVIETFSHGNQPYLIIATMARCLLEGHSLSTTGKRASITPKRAATEASQPLVLMEVHHADAPTRAIYDDIKTKLGLPFVNTDYRALARWPTYFATAWADLAPKLTTPDYEAALLRIHNVVVDLARELPNPTSLSPDRLQDAARKDASLDEIREVVALFQWLLPGLVVNVGYLRAQIINDRDEA